MKKQTKTGKRKRSALQTWPQTPDQALKRGGGMYGTIPVEALPYSKRLEYVIEAVGEICSETPTDFDKTFLLQPLQGAIEWIQEGDPHGAAMIFFELGRRVERHYASAFDEYVKKALARHKTGKRQAAAMNELKVKKAEELRAFIRRQYRALEPQIRSGELRIRGKWGCAYEIIRDRVAAGGFEKPGLHESYRPSDSTIDRALDKKDTKRSKK